MRLYYSPDYDYAAGLPAAALHGFVVDKPTRIRRGMLAAGVAEAAFVDPPPLDDGDLERVHDAALIAALESSRAVATAVELDILGMLPARMVRRAVVAPQLRAAGGTAAAIADAAGGEWALNLSGGYHHARPGLSHGFCLINDVAVGMARLRATGDATPVLVLDLDLHQGDGNAAAFAGDASVFTASLHEEDAFPFPKLESDLDVGLRSGTQDAAYLEALDGLLAEVDARFAPKVVVYVAGSDPLASDPLGGLLLTEAGLLARDERVGAYARGLGCGLVALPAGGYTNRSPEINAAGFAALVRLAP